MKLIRRDAKLENASQKRRPRRRAGILALAVLAPFLLASGPAHKQAEPAPQKAAASKEDFRWFPAFMLKKTKKGFIVKEVSLGLGSKDLYETFLITPGDVDHSSRKKHRMLFRKFLSNLDALATKNPKVVEMLENNVFFIFPRGGNFVGQYVDRSMIKSPYMVLDKKGNPISPCLPKCSGLDIIVFDKMIEKRRMRHTFLHENLHNWWFEMLPEPSKKEFLSLVGRLCKGSERFTLPELWFMEKREEKDAIEWLHQTKISQGLIKLFIHEKFPSLSKEEKAELNEALGWYIDFSVLFDYNIKVEMTELERFIEVEAYTHLFDRKLVPHAFRSLYHSVISENELDTHIFAPNNYHLSSVKNIKALLPIATAFVSYAKDTIPND